MNKTADLLISLLENWIGIKSNTTIIDIYNKHKPLPRNYKMKYSDPWCAAGLSAAIISCDMVDLIGKECSCEYFIEHFMVKGIWIEDGTITPQRGDIIVYNWDDKTQENNGWADHIGVVTEVYGDKIRAIECNYKGTVGYRSIPIGWGYIRGYGRPKYDFPMNPPFFRTNEEIATEVIYGYWGNGEDRKVALTDAGYDYHKIQAIVNSRLAGISASNKTIEDIAKEVINGKWGNGVDRVKRLTEAGMDYKAVQKVVNEMLNSCK